MLAQVEVFLSSYRELKSECPEETHLSGLVTTTHLARTRRESNPGLGGDRAER